MDIKKKIKKLLDIAEKEYGDNYEVVIKYQPDMEIWLLSINSFISQSVFGDDGSMFSVNALTLEKLINKAIKKLNDRT